MTLASAMRSASSRQAIATQRSASPAGKIAVRCDHGERLAMRPGPSPPLRTSASSTSIRRTDDSYCDISR